MSTIFNIVGDVKALNSLIESLTDEETGETRELTPEEKETFGEWVSEEQEKFESKFDKICKVFKNLKASASVTQAERDTLKGEMDRLSKRAKARENEADRVKGLLWYAFDSLGMKKYKTDLFSAGIQATAASVKPGALFDVADAPEWLYKEPELSSTKIKEALTTGKLYQKADAENPLDRERLYYRDEAGEETVIPNLLYSQGQTLVVR